MADTATAATAADAANATPNANDNKATDKQKAALAKKKKRDRAKRKVKKAARRELPKTKVVVRRLPPGLPENEFMKIVSPWTSEDVVLYKLYIPGKLNKSKAKQSVFSRAYFHMKAMEAVIALHQGFDGYRFKDDQDNEIRAVVEFAPFQKTPKPQANPDTRQGTIDEDPDYLTFLESLKAEENGTTNGMERTDESLENRLAASSALALAKEQDSKPKTTPLLEHIRAQKAAQAAAKAKALANKKAAAAAAKAKGQKSDSAPPSDAKKASRRERDKRRKEEKKKAAAAAAAAAATPASTSVTTPETPAPTAGKKSSAKVSDKGPKSANPEGKKEAKRRPPKKKPDASNKQQTKAPVVKILGRTNAKPETNPNGAATPQQKKS